MKKVIALSVLLSGLFLTSQLFAQADIKTDQKPPVKEQKKDQNATNTGKDQKGQTGGYTKGGKTIKAPATKPPEATKPVSGSSTNKPGTTIYDRTGKIKAMVEADGTIRDPKGSFIGRYTEKGDFLGSNNEKLGSIKDGVIRNKDGNEAGKITKEGAVTNAKGKLLGTIYDDGTIRNSKGSILGTAPGVNKNISALVFFNKKKSSSTEKKQTTGTKPGFEMKPIEKR